MLKRRAISRARDHHREAFVGRSWRPVVVALPIALIVGALTPLDAQWFTYPSSRAPRAASGGVDLSAAAPRLTNGQPDLSGVWMTAEPACVIRGTLPVSELRKLIPPSLKCAVRQASFSRQSINIGIDMPDGLPYQPWLADLVQQRTANQAIDDPHIRCLPDPFLRAYGLPHYLKFVQTADLLDTKPWTVTVHQQFAGDTELIDEICAEGERFSKKLR